MSNQVQPATQPVARPDTSSRVAIIIGILLMTLLVVGVGGWLYLANIAGAVVATGTVQVIGTEKTLQHLDGGIVSAIHVQDGDRVKKGDVLISLDPTLLEAQTTIQESRLREALARRARLRAERDKLPAPDFDDPILTTMNIALDEDIKRGQIALFDARRKTREAIDAQLNERINQNRQQVIGIEGMKASRERQIEILQEELESKESLLKKGLTSKPQVLALQREQSNLSGQVADLVARKAQLAAAVSEINTQKTQQERAFLEEVVTELRTTDQEINELVQQYIATSESLKRVQIRAPVDGIIHKMEIFTEGGVISAGAPITRIVPQNELMEFSVSVPPQFVDNLYPSQPANIRFPAFNRHETPELHGTVKSVSALSIVDENTGQPYFEVKLAVSSSELAKLGDNTLLPGMPVEAYIKTEDRTALSYLAKPFMDQIRRAFREE